MTVPELVWSTRRVPSPDPVFTDTVRMDPEPVAAVQEAPEMVPVMVRLKGEQSTPATASENVTVKSAMQPLVGLGARVARVVEVTVGATVSLVAVFDAVAVFPAASVAVAV